MEHMVAIEDDGNKNIRNTFARLLPCLLVNRLWHDCAATIAWRDLIFDKSCEALLARFVKSMTDTQQEYHLNDDNNDDDDDDFDDKKKMQLARKSVFSNCLDYLMRTPTTATDVWKKKSNDLAIQLQQQLLNVYRKSVRSISLRKIKSDTINQHLERIAPYAVRVEQLDLYICDHLQNHAVVPFFMHGQLTHLSLAGCYRINDDVIIQAAQQCPRLQHLDVRACGRISDRAIAEVAMQCQNLRHLNVGRVRDRDRISIKSIRLIALHTQVSVLGLAGCDIDDECMRILVQARHHHLERISVNSCPRISNASIRACIQYCPNLSVFEIKECHRINDWSLIHWLQSQRHVLVTMCEQQESAANAWEAQQKAAAQNYL
ncbi:RNI-like protein [Lichtheimia hyalospora FSU 10163]|nr:RNI-like protein [Lichtheimia hyalospora FSU 10163]